MRNAVGKRFGRLLPRAQRGAYATCMCDCGRSKRVRVDHLFSGGTQSCGCLQAESRSSTHLKHGFNRKGKRRSEYRSWLCMRARCSYPNNNEFHRYGARGITVCDRWEGSFENFIADMGRKPTTRHSIDRFPDPYGNYEPANCRWATPLEQANNKRARA